MVWARPLLALALLVLAAAQRPPIAHLARAPDGDTFHLAGPECGAGKCAEFNGEAAGARGADACACACAPRAPLFREDVSLCVDHVAECTLAPFGKGSTAQKVPFVFLPLKGQIIHPSKEISFPGVQTPICAVSGSQFLTRRGFVDLRNSLDADVPFSLFRDEGRTFLQWTGESELRARMAGRLLLVRLLCRDVALAGATDLTGLFTPCVSFRVQGAPALHVNNVNEVLFASNAQSSENTSTSGLTVTEYVAIGIASLLLGLIYVASVFLYLHIRKRRRINDEIESKSKKSRGNDNSSGGFDHDIVVMNTGDRQSLEANEGGGVVKNNPLLSMGMGRHFHDMNGGFVNGCAQSEFMEHEQQLNIEMDVIDDDENSSKTQIISAVIHPGMLSTRSDFCLGDPMFHHEQVQPRDESGIERLPEENVSIVETMDGRDEKPEAVRTIGSTRRKLYFNPAYFEPDLLLDPPPAALEFLTKIREVITIAKHKMVAKRFQPVLNEIPEEETYQSYETSMEFHTSFGSQRSSMITLKRENSRKKPPSCLGCPGCKSRSQGDLTSRFLSYSGYGACANCSTNKGDKQSSIRKWLEDIPVMKQSLQYGEITQQSHNSGLLNSLLSLPMDINQTNRNSRRRSNRFDNTKSLHDEDLSGNYRMKSKAYTLSVRSEPPIRNYNLPLPDFSNYQCYHQQGLQTIARTDDITPIGINFKSPIAAHAAYNRNNINLHSSFMPDMINDLAHEHRKILAKYENNQIIKAQKEAKPISTQNGSDTPLDTYETDSLEKSMNVKGFSASTEYTEILSAQPSPSLSTALPLEEELTMRNEVYKINSSSGHSSTPSPNTDMKEQNIYETIGECTAALEAMNVQSTQQDDYSLVSEVYVNNNYNFGSAPTSPSGSESSVGSRKVSNINYTEKDEHPGRLTIVVQDSPENYIRIHESDGFEPDTLDRKHPKTTEKFGSPRSNKQTPVKNHENSLEKENKSQIQLKTNGTFKNNSTKHDIEDVDSSERPFNSLRDIYEHKNASSFTRPRLYNQAMTGTKSLGHLTTNEIDWNSEEGRILTLELRHSKRQRQCTPPTVKQLKSQVRPDVIPPLSPMDENPIYEQPKPPRRVPQNELNQKNVNDRSFNPRVTSNVHDAHKSHSPTCVSVNRTPCSPNGAPVKSSVASEYENIHLISNSQPRCSVQNSINLQKKLIDDELSRASLHKNEQYTTHMERDNFFKGNVSPNGHSHDKIESHRLRFTRALNPRKAQNHKEDSGYLSSDSNYSVQPGKRAIIHRLSCSETDDTENEARSESGAESVETNSVFFGSFRKFSAQDADQRVTNFNKRITKVDVFEPGKKVVAMQ